MRVLVLGSGQHQGNIFVSSGVAPGVLNFFSNFTIVDGSVNCDGAVLDTGTVNTNGNTITFTAGSFINCP